MTKINVLHFSPASRPFTPASCCPIFLGSRPLSPLLILQRKIRLTKVTKFHTFSILLIITTHVIVVFILHLPNFYLFFHFLLFSWSILGVFLKFAFLYFTCKINLLKVVKAGAQKGLLLENLGISGIPS